MLAISGDLRGIHFASRVQSFYFTNVRHRASRPQGRTSPQPTNSRVVAEIRQIGDSNLGGITLWSGWTRLPPFSRHAGGCFVTTRGVGLADDLFRHFTSLIRSSGTLSRARSRSWTFSRIPATASWLILGAETWAKGENRWSRQEERKAQDHGTSIIHIMRQIPAVTPHSWIPGSWTPKTDCYSRAKTRRFGTYLRQVRRIDRLDTDTVAQSPTILTSVWNRIRMFRETRKTSEDRQISDYPKKRPVAIGRVSLNRR